MCFQGLNNDCGESSTGCSTLRTLWFYKWENSEISVWHGFKTIANISISQNLLPRLGAVVQTSPANTGQLPLSSCDPQHSSVSREQPWAFDISLGSAVHSRDTGMGISSPTFSLCSLPHCLVCGWSPTATPSHSCVYPGTRDNKKVLLDSVSKVGRSNITSAPFPSIAPIFFLSWGTATISNHLLLLSSNSGLLFPIQILVQLFFHLFFLLESK